MSKLGEYFSIVAGLINAIIVFLGMSLFGFLFYYGIQGFWGVFTFILISCLGLFLAYKVFISIWRRGYLSFLASNYSSPDLDSLEPTMNSDFRELSVFEFYENWKNYQIICTGGKVNIWGDFRSRGLDMDNQIKQVALDSSETLTIIFKNSNKLTVVKPQIIHESESYIKILRASEVTWEWCNTTQKKQHFFKYYLESTGRIKTTSDFKWKSYSEDYLYQKSAVFIFNNNF